MSRPYRELNETELLARAKAAARQRLGASLGLAGANARDGAGHVGSLVQRHPLIAMASAVAIGFVGVKIGQRFVRTISGRHAPLQRDETVAPVGKPRHGFLHGIVIDLLLPILTQRLMAMVSSPETEAEPAPPSSSPAPSSSSPTDSI